MEEEKYNNLEEFNHEEEEFNHWEDQNFLTQHPYRPAPESVPFYQPAPVFTPYPMYIQPDYRSYHPAHGYHHAQPSTIDHHPSHHHPGHHPSHYNHHDKKDPEEHVRRLYDMCKRHRYYFIQCENSDGQVYEGIIDDVDDEGVYLLEPVGDMDWEDYDMSRQFGYGFPGAGFGFPRRFRRFRRRRFPFFGLRRLLFPFF